jgi:hypothetical protein
MRVYSLLLGDGVIRGVSRFYLSQAARRLAEKMNLNPELAQCVTELKAYLNNV